MSRGMGKATALRWLAAHLGVDLADCMAFGDNDDAGFRIYTEKNNWDVCYTYKGGGYEADGIHLAFHDEGGDPPQIFPGQEGYPDAVYNISFDITSMVLVLAASVK